MFKRLILLGLAISGTLEAFKLVHDATKSQEPRRSFAGRLLLPQGGQAAQDDARYGCGCGG